MPKNETKEDLIEDLEESEEEFKNLVSYIPGAVFSCTDDGTMTFINDRIEKITGYPASDFINNKVRTFVSIVHKDDIDRIAGVIKEALKDKEKTYMVEYRIMHKDGSTRWVSNRGRIFCNKDGSAREIEGIIFDITEHKEARQALAESEERFRKLFEDANDIIYIHDLQGKFVAINQEAVRVFGYSQEEARSVSIAQIVDKDYLPLAMQKIQEKLKGSPSTKPYELLTHTKSGEPIWVEVSTRLLTKGGVPSGVQGIARDVTERKEAERASMDFVSLASHQLRTPLTTIKLVADTLVRKEIPLTKKQEKEFLEKIFDSTDDMILLVEDLLNVSRFESGRLELEPEPVDLVDFIEKEIDNVTVVAEEVKCKVIFKKPREELAKANIDPHMFKQVVHNLLTNAIRYSPENKGEVVVGLEEAESGKKILLSIKDNGIGISEEEKHRVFDKFFRTVEAKKKVKIGGTGLGLYLAKMIIEASGGKIWFESSGTGKGTTFSVAMPLE